jgi:methyl acetate hydrolase
LYVRHARDDTVYFDIASMMKAVTTVAAIQLVEHGKMALDVPTSQYLAELDKPNVLVGFDAAGKPELLPAVKPVTLRHLFSHSSGYAYDTLNENMYRYVRQVRGQRRKWYLFVVGTRAASRDI